MTYEEQVLRDVNKHLDEAAMKVRELNEMIKVESKLVLRPDPPVSYQNNIKYTIEGKKKNGLKVISETLAKQELNPEVKKAIQGECQKILDPSNALDIKFYVDKFKAEQPKLDGTPEHNKTSIENWAKQLNTPLKEQEKQAPQSKSYEAPRLAPPITEKFNDKAEKKPPTKKWKDRERDI